jgi:pimeloyl-ACP methyl ester carboxylesterase
MIDPRLDGKVRLPDSRCLSYAEFGAADGAPILLFHGLPGSRLSWGLLPGDPFPKGSRIIAPDRPGYGGSNAKPGRTLLDWAGDVAALADDLGLNRFGIVGVSGGGPGALACACSMPERVARVGVVAGATPTDVPGVFDGMSGINRFFMRLAWRAPGLSALNTRLLAGVVRRDPGRYVDAMQRKLHEADRAVLARPGVRDMLVCDFAEALRQGGQGMVDDMACNHGRPWGFDLRESRVPVHLWYGALDRSIPPAMGRYLANTLPDARLTLLPEAGHLWVLLHLRRVLETMMGPAAARGQPVLETWPGSGRTPAGPPLAASQ